MGLYTDEKLQSEELLERFNVVKGVHDVIQNELGAARAKVQVSL